MAITYIPIWLMPKSMLLTGVLTTPHMGNWVVSMCEETRPQSAKTRKQDHKIKLRTDLRALASDRCSIHSKYLVHSCIILSLSPSLPLDLSSLSITSGARRCARSSTGGRDSEKTHRHTPEEMAGWQECRTAWLHRQREFCRWTLPLSVLNAQGEDGQ